MRIRNSWVWVLIVAFVVCFAHSVIAAETEESVDRVEFKEGKVRITKEGKLVVAEQNLALPNNIKVTTNGTYRVNGGKVRTLKEGQVIDKDGMLSSPDGSIVPVINHVARRTGQILLIEDGDERALDREFVFPNGVKVLPDGTMRTPGGKFRRLLDGDWFTMDGNTIPSRDTITLRQGVVVVQKDGSQFRLRPTQTLMMNDGTKALGNGTVKMKDGTTVTLTEGQVLVVEGVAHAKD